MSCSAQHHPCGFALQYVSEEVARASGETFVDWRLDWFTTCKYFEPWSEGVYTTASRPFEFNFRVHPSPCSDSFSHYMADSPPGWRVYFLNFPPACSHHSDILSKRAFLPIVQRHHPVVSSEKLRYNIRRGRRSYTRSRK